MSSAKGRKLRFQVAFVSGEDPDYPASELNVHSPQTRGWQSPRCVVSGPNGGSQLTDRWGVRLKRHGCAVVDAIGRFCEYPQEIGIQFLEAPVRMTQVQLLSHQSKIATKIELFVGQGSDYYTCHWRRLGCVRLAFVI